MMPRIRAYFARVASRSPEERFNYALRISTAVTGVLFLMWFVHFLLNLGDALPAQPVAQTAQSESAFAKDAKQALDTLVEATTLLTTKLTDTPPPTEGVKELDSQPLVLPASSTPATTTNADDEAQLLNELNSLQE